MIELLIVALAIFAFGMLSENLSMSPITAPMVFTTVGLVVGTAGLGWFDLRLEGETASILVEATLVLVLFTDAVRIDLRVLRRQSSIPTRLLSIGLPLTIVAGTIVAYLLFEDLDLAAAGLVAAVLAPTDAALGQAVVSDPRLPARIRQGLNVESGLNDGIMVPVITVLIAVAAVEAGQDSGTAFWAEFVARQIGFGLLCGLAAGLGGGWLLHHQATRSRIDGVFRQLATIAVAVGAFAGAELLEGNGFIAAFVAGIAFGKVAPEECSNVSDFTEDEGELLTAITFLTFGAVLAGPLLGDLTWQIAVYAVASLTVVRVVPVLIAMTGSGTRFETRLFLGWFGPRGLASILFGLLVLQELGGTEAETIFTVAVWTVLLSIFAHGVTASPWAGRLGDRLSKGPEDMAEMEPVPELPTRRRLP